MTVYCGMSFDNLGLHSKKTINIGVCLEHGLICSKHVAVVGAVVETMVP